MAGVGDDEWSAQTRVFRVVAAPDEAEDYNHRVLGVGVDFPEAAVYVDWHREAFPDALSEPHVSEYGSVDDLTKATGNVVEPPEQLGEPDSAGDGDVGEKEWVPYTGPRGGQGWRNTTTERIRYTDEAPDASGGDGPGDDSESGGGQASLPDPEDLTATDVEEARILQSEANFDVDGRVLSEGESVIYSGPERDRQATVEEIRPDEREMVLSLDESGGANTITVPLNENMNPTEDGASFRQPRDVFIGAGVASSYESWLPDDGSEPTDEQLRAEALRAAASGNTASDTGNLESLAARLIDLDVAREDAIDALRYGLDVHPAFDPERAEHLYENGERLRALRERLAEDATDTDTPPSTAPTPTTDTDPAPAQAAWPEPSGADFDAAGLRLVQEAVAEHGEEWVLEKWDEQIAPVSRVLDLPEKESLPFYDGDEGA